MHYHFLPSVLSICHAVPAGVDVDAFIPELWAMDGLVELEANVIMPFLVNRDYENDVRAFGDIVNVPKVSTMRSRRKHKTTDITTDPAVATNIQVPLNMHIYASTLIPDEDLSKAQPELLAKYGARLAAACARQVDENIIGTMLQLRSGDTVGKLGTAPSRQTFIDIGKTAKNRNAPFGEWWMVFNPNMESDLLATTNLVDADVIGDGGAALREGFIGRKFGINTVWHNAAPSISGAHPTLTGAINLGAGYVKGTSTFVVDGLSAAIAAGTWVTIAGDMTPLRVVSTVGGGTPTSITTDKGSSSAVVDNAVVTLYTPGAINLGAGYATNHGEELTVDAFTVAPEQGQLISFDATNAPHGIVTGTIGGSTTSLLLNRPTDAALLDNATVAPGPIGEYGFAFHPDTMALVSRPLASPPSGTGVLSSVQSANNLSIRVVMGYDKNSQGMQMTYDLLMGTAIVESELGMVVFG